MKKYEKLNKEVEKEKALRRYDNPEYREAVKERIEDYNDAIREVEKIPSYIGRTDLHTEILEDALDDAIEAFWDSLYRSREKDVGIDSLLENEVNVCYSPVNDGGRKMKFIDACKVIDGKFSEIRSFLVHTLAGAIDDALEQNIDEYYETREKLRSERDKLKEELASAHKTKEERDENIKAYFEEMQK